MEEEAINPTPTSFTFGAGFGAQPGKSPKQEKMDELIEQMKLMNERLGKMDERMGRMEQLVQIHDDWLILNYYYSSRKVRTSGDYDRGGKYAPVKTNLNNAGELFDDRRMIGDDSINVVLTNNPYKGFRTYKEQLIIDERKEQERKDNLKRLTENGEKIEFTPEQLDEIIKNTPEGQRLLQEKKKRLEEETGGVSREDSSIASLADKLDKDLIVEKKSPDGKTPSNVEPVCNGPVDDSNTGLNNNAPIYPPERPPERRNTDGTVRINTTLFGSCVNKGVRNTFGRR